MQQQCNSLGRDADLRMRLINANELTRLGLDHILQRGHHRCDGVFPWFEQVRANQKAEFGRGICLWNFDLPCFDAGRFTAQFHGDLPTGAPGIMPQKGGEELPLAVVVPVNGTVGKHLRTLDLLIDLVLRQGNKSRIDDEVLSLKENR